MDRKNTDRNPELLDRLQSGEDTEQELLEINMGLVKSIARRFLFSGVEFDDLTQIGAVGLLKAIRNFEPQRGVMFSTYAVPVIAGEIKKFLRDNGPVKVSRSVREQYCRIAKASAAFSSQNGRAPTISELQEITGIPAEEIVFASDAGSRPLSFDDPLGDGGVRTLGDTVPDPDDGGSRLDSWALRQCLDMLPTEDRKIISLRYYLNKTQQETADILGMTQVQISRREKKIMQLLRQRLTG